MQTSEHFGLNMPESTDFVDVEDLSENFDDIDAQMFAQLESLITKTTSIGKNAQDQTEIIETDSSNSISSVTTIVPTSETVTTITQVITTAEHIYTKTTTITKSGSGTSISESFTTAPVE